MTIRFAAATAAILVLSGSANANVAAPPCGQRSDIVGQLAERHGEQRVALGLAQNGQVMELWVGPEGGWTLLASLPTGVSCVVAVGEQLQLTQPQAPADPA
tara:strand:- start:971 stop:1273 length:303 start_codon:yes stop_codon:yes gene_type:complete